MTMGARSALALLFASSVALGACTTTPPPPAAPVENAPADIAAVVAVRAGFVSAYAAGDAEAVGRLYTADAISEPNNQPALKGRDAIVQSQKAMFAQVTIKAEMVSDETRTIGNVGLDRGRYLVSVTPKAGGETTTVEGRYLVVLVKEADGVWRVKRDMDNAAEPPQASPAPAADAAPAR
jgi:uncharacterized protein (TIGR02246 family)